MGKHPAGHGSLAVNLTAEGIEAIAEAVVSRLIERGLVRAIGIPFQSNGKRGGVPVEPGERLKVNSYDDVDQTKILKLPETGFLRLSAVLALIPVAKSTWWKGVKSGRYPQGVKLGIGVTAWRAEDIRELINQLGGGEQ